MGLLALLSVSLSKGCRNGSLEPQCVHNQRRALARRVGAPYPTFLAIGGILIAFVRRDDVIGDDAYRILVQELDWAELSAGGGRQD